MTHALTRLCLVATLLAAGLAQAQEPPRRDGPDRRPGAGAERSRPAPAPAQPLHFDRRYHHDHYYPPAGFAIGVLPGGSISIAFGGGSFFFNSGVWYRPVGTRFVVVAPPIGIVVPLLPPAFVTLWIGGQPYYYANGVYYATAVGTPGYVVVDPPSGADAAQPVPAPTPASGKALPDPIFYPRNGQTAAQTEADRIECNRWATTQPQAMADASVFQRAVAACMDGRGYTVR